MAELERHISVWNECLRIFEQNVEPKQFDVWFKTIVPVSLEGSTLTVEVPTDFFRSYLEDAFLPIIKMTLRRVIGQDARLLYKIHPVQKERAMVFTASHGNVPENKPVTINTFQPSGNPSPFVFPGIQKLKINPRLNPVYCFDNLIKGECNKMGYNAGISISDKPGKTPFNPVARDLARPISRRRSVSPSTKPTRILLSSMSPATSSGPSTSMRSVYRTS